MPKLSAGLLPFRVSDKGGTDVFIVHPGGPFWTRKDDGAWSIAKGEYEPEEEDPEDAARREFVEEVGAPAPAGRSLALGEVRQPSGKRITVWAVDAPAFDIDQVVSNEFEIEWPPRSGRTQHFPEVDRAEWMPIAVARRKLVKGQVEFLDRLSRALIAKGLDPADEGEGR